MVKVACFVGNTYLKVASTEGTCIASTYARRAYIGDAYIGSTCAKSACTRVVSDNGACIESVYAIECSKIYSQSFQILEVGGARLEI